MKKILHLLTMSILLISLLNCGKKPADEPVVQQNRAAVIMVMGNVLIYKSGTITPAKYGMDISDADFVETKASSQCRIMFSKGGSLSLEPLTKISIKLVANSNSVRSKLSNGSVLASVRRVTNDQEFSIQTPTAVAGARGTKFMVSYNSQNRQTQVAVGAGKVKVAPAINVQTNDKVKKHIQESIGVDLSANQRVEVNNAQVEQVNTIIERDIEQIEREVQRQEQASAQQTPAPQQQQTQTPSQTPMTQPQPMVIPALKKIATINRAESIIKVNKAPVTVKEKKILERIPDANAPEQSASRRNGYTTVTIEIPEAVLTINNVETRNIYSAKIKAGEKITLKVQKPGYMIFENTYTIPDAEVYIPQVDLKKIPQYATTPAERLTIQDATLVRVAARYVANVNTTTNLITYNGKVFFGGNDKNYYIIDMNGKGKLLSKVNIGAVIQSTPVLLNDTVYFGANNKVLYAVNLKTNRIVFATRLEESLANKNMVVANGAYIYFAVEGILYKLNRYNGKIMFKTTLEENLGGFASAVDKVPVKAAVAIDNARVFVADSYGFIRAFDKVSGKLLWKKFAGYITGGQVFEHNGRVIGVSSNGWLVVVSAEDGKPITSITRVGEVSGMPSRVGKLVYFPTRDNSVKVFNLETLSVIKEIRTHGLPRMELSSGSYIVNNQPYRLSQFSIFGNHQWSTAIDSEMNGNPAADDLYVYALTKAGLLYKINRYYRIKHEK